VNDIAKVVTTLVSAMIVFACCWVLVGFAARIVATLFCWGYGC
jgi:hypothetical protein